MKDTNRIDFLRALARRRKIDFKQILEILLDAQVSLKKLAKTINISGKEYEVERKGLGPITNEHGKFYQGVFEVNDRWKRYFVVTKSDLDKEQMVPLFNPEKEIYLRIDSGCSSGQLFGDLTCECRDQLDLSLSELSKKEQGLLIYIPGQDGRGKGTEFKLATLYLQEHLGLDTTESFSLLEKDNSFLSMDERDYDGVIAILKFLNIPLKVTLWTNNPKKAEALVQEGFIVKKEAVLAKATPYTKSHLEAKKRVLGHTLTRNV